MHVSIFRPRLVLLLALCISVMMWFPSAYGDSGQWVKYSGNPVLTPTSNAWDSVFVTSPRVIFDGTSYRMWYVGGHAGATDIGYANSTDGVIWHKYSTFVLSPGPNGTWDSARVWLGSVIWNGSLFFMWYQGSSPVAYPNGAIGLATSVDGVSWVKYAGNPVLTPSSVDQKYIATPFVVRLISTYSMWYAARSAFDPNSVIRILYATSADGIRWSKWPSPALSPSLNMSVWDSGAVFSPSVIYDGSNFGMWYSGMNQSLIAQIGYASSPDGATWTKSADNPILSPGPPGTWDSAGVQQAATTVGNGLMLYYDGFTNTTTGAIGLARSPPGFTIAEFPSPLISLFLVLITCAAICSTLYKRERMRK